MWYPRFWDRAGSCYIDQSISAPPLVKEEKIQATQTEGEKGLLDNGELLRGLFACFGDVPLLGKPTQEREAKPWWRYSLS